MFKEIIKITKISVVIVGLSVLLGSCGGQVSKTMIVGGVNITNQEKTSVLLSSVGLTTPELNRSHKTFCSAVIISKRSLLTAAHCVDKYLDYKTGQISAVFGNVVKGWGNRRLGNSIPVQGIAIHHAYQKIIDRKQLEKRSANDLAILYLSREVSAPFKAVEIVSPSRVLESYSNIVLSGFGVTGGFTSDDSGELRAVDVTSKLENNDAKTIELEGPKLTGTRIEDTNDGGYVYKEATGGSCNGDSGGPAYIWQYGKFTLLGVTAFGDSQRLAKNPNGPSYCVGGSFVTDLRFYGPYIMQAAGSIENSYLNRTIHFNTKF
ncbi:trypsin-like serine protease [bacterium]|nr:trypsin-like serine protease [bacterium]